MRTITVTFGDVMYQQIAEVLAERFQDLNGIEAMAIDPMKAPNLEDVAWIKAWVWDLVPSDVGRVIWFDANILPLLSVTDLLVPSYDYPFAAVEASPEVRQEATWKLEEVRSCLYYFCTSMFVARRVTRPIFEDVKRYASSDPSIGVQSAFNLCLNRYYKTLDVASLSVICNWKMSFGPMPTDARMLQLDSLEEDARLQMMQTFTRVFEQKAKFESHGKEVPCTV